MPAGRPGDLVGHRARRAARDRRCAPTDEPVPVSASALERLLTCPAQWFLAARGRRSGAQLQPAQGFGKIVHALAERIAKGELAAGPDDVDG